MLAREHLHGVDQRLVDEATAYSPMYMFFFLNWRTNGLIFSFTLALISTS